MSSHEILFRKLDTSCRNRAQVAELKKLLIYFPLGSIRLHFTILNGSLHSLSSDERLAVVGTDVLVNSTSILVKNGASVGAIPLSIANDNLAELDEYFVVNITNVELVNKSSLTISNETFTPPRLGRYLTSEVKIEKNDGPQGILVFSPARFVSHMKGVTHRTRFLGQAAVKLITLII